MDTKNIYQKLQALRVDLQEKDLKKTGHNKYAKYKYFQLDDFIPEVNKLMKKHKLTSVINYGDTEAELKILNTEGEKREFITFKTPMSTASLKGCHEVQNLGAVQTYLRRYLWINALEITEEDPLEAQTGNKQPTNKNRESNVSKVIKKKIDSAKDLETLEKAKDYINNNIKKNKQDLLDLVATKKMKIKSEQEDDGIPVVEDDES